MSCANVSYFMKEFNVTKPTISDAVKHWKKKNLIIKDFRVWMITKLYDFTI